MSAIEEQPEGIDVATALRKARDTLVSIMAIEEAKIYNIRLEEVRHHDNADEWLITYGYDVPVEELPGTPVPTGALAGLFPKARSTRVYQVIVLDGQTGRFKEMRMRATATQR